MILDPDTGRIAVGKKLSSSDSPVWAVIEGMQDILSVEDIAPQEIIKAIHGTTLVTNLIIERKGAKTGLLTTSGFRDALEIAREMRYDIYDIFLELPKPLSPRRHRLEVAERLDNAGNVLIPLTQQEAERAVNELLALDVEAAAICLLHSFRNPIHMKESSLNNSSGLFSSLRQNLSGLSRLKKNFS